MIKKITIAALVTCMMIGFVSCGNETSKSDSQQNTIQEAEDDKKVSDKAEGSADAHNENEETPAPTDAESSDDKTLPSVEVNLPKGADSVYSLYTTVIDFLNSGFHYDDLKDVYDPVLRMAFYSKLREDEEDILTYGLDLKDSYALIKGLADNADVDQLTHDYDGDDDDIDFEALKKGLPDDMIKQLDKYPDAYEDYAERIYIYLSNLLQGDGKNPFRTSQTSWEKIPESDFSVEEFDYYDDFNKDLEKAFPDIKEISLGRYEEGNEVYDMYVYCIEVDGRYYLLGSQWFSTIGNETSKSDSQQNTIQEAEDDKKVSDKAEGSADAHNENEETPAPTDAESSDDKTMPSVEVNLPKGADSVYSLYTTVIDFLNSGFHYDDLKDVYDPVLRMALDSKLREDEEDILTYGLDLKDSYALIKGLADNVDVDLLTHDYDGDNDIDLEALKKGLPDDMIKQLDKYPDAYEHCAEDIYEILSDLLQGDGKNPFRTSQTSWEKIPESDFSVEEFDYYDDFNKDLEKAFPDIKEISLGRYQVSDGVYKTEKGNEVFQMMMYFCCIEVDGRYYLIEFYK